MELIGDVVSDGTSVLEAYAKAARKTSEAVLLQGGRGAIRHVISITPPATANFVPGGLDSGSEAKARGARAIERDLNILFAPVRLKHKRRERISGAEMVRIHLKHLGYKRPGAKMKRYGGPYYVDAIKFKALAEKLRSHVGRLASGWYSAAAALGVKVPQWISRHGTGRGTYRCAFEGDLMFIESVNLASSFAPVEELRRRVPYAVSYAMNDMKRATAYLLERDARRIGLVPIGPIQSSG